MSFTKLLTSLLMLTLLAIPVLAQDKSQADLKPVEVVKQFYQLLRDKQYVEGFGLSIYREAIIDLTPDELKELAPDFENTFSKIPGDIKILGSQINGHNATVFIKTSTDPKDYKADEVQLIQVDNRWLIGDPDTLNFVHSLGRKFFFEIRIRAHEDIAEQYMGRYLGAEKLYFDTNRGAYGSHDELVKANFWPETLKSGEIDGYKYSIEVSKDKREFSIHAEPLSYNKSGRLSFYADLRGIYKLDTAGKPYHPTFNTTTNK